MTRPLAGLAIGLLLAASACSHERPEPKVPADRSALKAATDVFWALQKLGFVVAKHKPSPTKHACTPFEYIAQKGAAEAIVARFRISVFECPTPEQAAEIVEHAHTRHVDSLLRNRHEGGVLRRQALEIIVRMERGEAADADGLLEAIGGM